MFKAVNSINLLFILKYLLIAENNWQKGKKGKKIKKDPLQGIFEYYLDQRRSLRTKATVRNL